MERRQFNVKRLKKYLVLKARNLKKYKLNRISSCKFKKKVKRCTESLNDDNSKVTQTFSPPKKVKRSLFQNRNNDNTVESSITPLKIESDSNNVEDLDITDKVCTKRKYVRKINNTGEINDNLGSLEKVRIKRKYVKKTSEEKVRIKRKYVRKRKPFIYTGPLKCLKMVNSIQDLMDFVDTSSLNEDVIHELSTIQSQASPLKFQQDNAQDPLQSGKKPLPNFRTISESCYKNIDEPLITEENVYRKGDPILRIFTQVSY